MLRFEFNQVSRGFLLDKAFEVRHRKVGDGGDAWWCTRPVFGPLPPLV